MYSANNPNDEIELLRAEVEKLRAENNEAYVFGLHKGKEAAFIDYGIERLRAENAKLRAALKPFADMAKYCHDMHVSENQCLFMEDLRAAATALKGNNES